MGARWVSLGMSLALAGCRSPASADGPAPPPAAPATAGEVPSAAARLLASMDEADKAAVRETRKEDLIRFHRGWGRSIRNEFGL